MHYGSYQRGGRASKSTRRGFWWAQTAKRNAKICTGSWQLSENRHEGTPDPRIGSSWHASVFVTNQASCSTVAQRRRKAHKTTNICFFRLASGAWRPRWGSLLSRIATLTSPFLVFTSPTAPPVTKEQSFTSTSTLISSSPAAAASLHLPLINSCYSQCVATKPTPEPRRPWRHPEVVPLENEERCVFALQAQQQEEGGKQESGKAFQWQTDKNGLRSRWKTALQVFVIASKRRLSFLNGAALL